MQYGSSPSFKPCVEGLEERALMAAHLTATLSNGLLRIDGTKGADHIVVREHNYRISIDHVSINVAGHGRASSVSASAVSRIEVRGLAGDDWIQVGGDEIRGQNALLAPVKIWAGLGNDKVWGGQGSDEIHGEGGNDQVWGRGGNDRIYGGEGRDWLDGGAGANYLAGQANDDVITSRSARDVVDGGTGRDTLNLTGTTHPRSAVNVEVIRHLPGGRNALLAESPFAADASRLIELIDAYRHSRGLQSLTIDSRLMASAQYQADYMARTGHYAHDNLDGRTLVDRVHAAGYSFSFAAENIHLYDPAIRRTLGINRVYSVDQLAQYYFDGWKVSPGHNATMLSAQVHDIGVGIAQDQRTGRIYVAADFGHV